MGVTLVAREINSLQLLLPNDEKVCYEILHIFPFTSERKRMGIIVKVCVYGNRVVWYICQCFILIFNLYISTIELGNRSNYLLYEGS